MEGAATLFRQTEELYGFQYPQMLSTYKLLDFDPYDSRSIEKLEGINHITKRMGTALRSLVEKQKAQGEPIGGQDKLTDVTINP